MALARSKEPNKREQTTSMHGTRRLPNDSPWLCIVDYSPKSSCNHAMYHTTLFPRNIKRQFPVHLACSIS